VFVRAVNSQPVDYYKTVSDNSVQSDNDATDISENEMNDITPSTLQTDLIVIKQPIQNKKPPVKEKEKKTSNVQKKIDGLGKKNSCNPTDDLPIIIYEPSKLQKKSNPNDSKLADPSTVIRKFK